MAFPAIGSLFCSFPSSFLEILSEFKMAQSTGTSPGFGGFLERPSGLKELSIFTVFTR